MEDYTENPYPKDFKAKKIVYRAEHEAAQATLDEPGGAKAAAAVLPGSSSATDEDDMRETRSYFHELDLEAVEWEDHGFRWSAAPLGEDQA